MADHVCPPSVGRLLVNPLRKLFQNPIRILSPYVSPGMNVADIGCAMGFFSLPLAKLVGIGGHVYCIDIQEEMITEVERRANNVGLSGRITTRLCTKESLQLDDVKGTLDFTLAYYVVHEVPDAGKFLSEVIEVLKPGGHLLVEEPKGHVSEAHFEEMAQLAEEIGFTAKRSSSLGNRTILLKKADDELDGKGLPK